MSKTARPPGTLALRTSPALLGAPGGEESYGGPLDSWPRVGGVDRGGFDERDSEGVDEARVGEGSGGFCVEEAPGAAVDSLPDRGSVRGASYSVLSRTVCTPNHERVTAALVASAHAAACTSGRPIAATIAALDIRLTRIGEWA